MDNQYKRTLAGSVGAGMGAIFNGNGRSYYILEHKTATEYHNVGESQKIIVDQVELGRDSSCQVRFDEKCETVSRRHAAIVKEGDNWKLLPLSQTNATFVNGHRIESEYILNSGDEIQLSSHGPVMGFIIPQGEQSLVKSIGMTERLNLFRKQALRPYKTALIISFIVLVLAVGGLVALNIHNNKVANERIDAQGVTIDQQQQQISSANENLAEANSRIEALKEQDAANKQVLSELTEKAEKAEADRSAAQSTLDSLKSKANATKAELDAANERLKNAENMASMANRAARDAKAAVSETQKKISEAQSTIAQTQAEVEEKTEKVSEPTEKEQEKETGATKEFTSIDECINAVYYIKMNNVTVWDEDNRPVVDLNCENLVGGTGFMLEDGRFITARRVVEPWFYYINSDEKLRTLLGRDSKGNYWYFEDIQVCVNKGLKVVANYTAYSPSGANFQFKSTDMRTNPSKSGVDRITYTRPNGRVEKLFRAESFELNWFNTNPGLDWASMQKSDQLLLVKGLKYSNSYSSSPVGGTEVSMLGYPQKEGFSDSQIVQPIEVKNNINVSGLNDKSVIEMASRRYRVGNDGSPVLVKLDDVWTVIGILGHTDGVDRDMVTPIANTNK